MDAEKCVKHILPSQEGEEHFENPGEGGEVKDQLEVSPKRSPCAPWKSILEERKYVKQEGEVSSYRFLLLNHHIPATWGLKSF